MCKAWLTSRDDDATLSLKDQFTNVGRNRISFTSTSSGWLMANATARANDWQESRTTHTSLGGVWVGYAVRQLRGCPDGNAKIRCRPVNYLGSPATDFHLWAHLPWVKAWKAAPVPAAALQGSPRNLRGLGSCERQIRRRDPTEPEYVNPFHREVPKP